MTVDFIDASTIKLANNHFQLNHEGSAVIMSIQAGKYFTFDQIGFEIWEALRTPTTLGSLVATLASRHHAPVEVVRHDVVGFIAELARADLIAVS